MKKTSLLALSLIGPFAFLAPAHAADKEAAPAKASAKIDLAKIFDGKLFDAEGNPVKTDSIKKAKYVVVYSSAHWCVPCRAFTPKLVEFVNANRKDGNFEVVLLSSDWEQKHMLSYMTGAKMPWAGALGNGRADKDHFKPLTVGQKGIPHLRVYDAGGEVVIDAVKDGKYVGPQYVLEELKKKL